MNFILIGAVITFLFIPVLSFLMTWIYANKIIYGVNAFVIMSAIQIMGILSFLIMMKS